MVIVLYSTLSSQVQSVGTVLCSWLRHFTLPVPLSTQVYKWVPANLMLGVTLQWTSILSSTLPLLQREEIHVLPVTVY